MDITWPRTLNQLLASNWHDLKNGLVMKDIVDHMIQKRVISLEYWIGLKAKPVTECERTEDFLSLVLKFNQEKYSFFLDALVDCGHMDLADSLTPPQEFKLPDKQERGSGGRRSAASRRSLQGIPPRTQIEISEWSAGDVPQQQSSKKRMVQSLHSQDTSDEEDHGRNDKMKATSDHRKNEQLLNTREKVLQAKEAELKTKETRLNEQEKQLQKREHTILKKEHDFLNLKLDQSKVDNDEENVKSQNSQVNHEFQNTGAVTFKDIQSLQEDLDEIKSGIQTDREDRTTLHEKIEDQKSSVAELQLTLSSLTMEKETIEEGLRQEVDELKGEIASDRLSFHEDINRMRIKFLDKEKECKKLKANITEVEKVTKSLEHRVTTLEKQNKTAAKDIVNYNTEVAELKKELKNKDDELKEMKKLLSEVECDKEELIDEVAILKTQLAQVREEKKRLEQEKKSLLNRCVVPRWNNGPNRKSSSFK